MPVRGETGLARAYREGGARIERRAGAGCRPLDPSWGWDRERAALGRMSDLWGGTSTTLRRGLRGCLCAFAARSLPEGIRRRNGRQGHTKYAPCVADCGPEATQGAYFVCPCRPFLRLIPSGRERAARRAQTSPQSATQGACGSSPDPTCVLMPPAPFRGNQAQERAARTHEVRALRRGLQSGSDAPSLYGYGW